MVSVNYSSNTSILTILRQTQNDIEISKKRISSGLKVASASDDPYVWQLSQTAKTASVRNKVLLTGMSTYKGITDAASAGLDTITSALNEITSLAATMQSAGSASSAQMAQLAGYQNKITAAIAGSSFGQVNLLTSSSAVSASIGYRSDSTAIQATYAANAIASDTDMAAVLAASPDLSTAPKISAYATNVANAVTKMAVAAANVASFAGSIDSQSSLLTKLDDIQDKYIGSLVNADIEDESAKVQALQVKLQLQYQALAISSTSAASILRLFQ